MPMDTKERKYRKERDTGRKEIQELQE